MYLALFSYPLSYFPQRRDGGRKKEITNKMLNFFFNRYHLKIKNVNPD